MRELHSMRERKHKLEMLNGEKTTVELFKEITLLKATKDAVKRDGGSKFLLRRTKRLKVSLHRIYAAPLKSISLFSQRGNLQGAFC